jgi:magnesium transporter
MGDIEPTEPMEASAATAVGPEIPEQAVPATAPATVPATAPATGPATAPATVPATTHGTEPATAHGTATGISRALTAPMRAMTRILGVTPAHPSKPGGRPSAATAIVDCAVYVRGERLPGEWGYEEAFAAARKRDDAFVWLGLHEPGLHELAAIGETFQLDDFAVEDAVKGGQRPKVEQYGHMTFLVLRTARYVEHKELTETSEIVETGDLMMFVGANFVITVRHGDLSALKPVRDDLEANPDLLSLGPWAVVYGIVDRIVDSYVDVASMVEEDIDAVESHVFSRESHGRIARIYQLKRELVEFKRAVVPLQRPVNAIVEGKLGAVSPEVLRYFRDVNDHLIRTVDKVISYDDLLNSILQARLAQVTVDQNHDMRKIAAWAAIAAMQTAIAGIYGMNFRVMPETSWKYGYPVILLVMFGSAIALYRLFRRSGWL